MLNTTVPCLRRAACIEAEYEAAGGEVLLDDEEHDGWLATHGKPKGVYVCVCCYIGLEACMYIVMWLALTL